MDHEGHEGYGAVITHRDCKSVATELSSFFQIVTEAEAVAVAVFHVEVTAAVGLVADVPGDLHVLGLELRLQRVGNVFTAYYGSNGTGWTQVFSTTIALPQTVHLGLASSAYGDVWLQTW